MRFELAQFVFVVGEFVDCGGRDVSWDGYLLGARLWLSARVSCDVRTVI